MTRRQFLTATEAAQALGITRATLYAYTSRGQLRSEPVPGEPRERRYHRDDVERLQDRKALRRDPSRAAAKGLRWGEPVLESAITLVHGGTFYYRGRDAVALAERATLEDVAALLWDAPSDAAAALFAQPGPLGQRELKRIAGLTSEVRTALQVVLPIAGALDAAALDLRPAAVRATGARIVRLFASVIAGRPTAGPIDRTLQEAWTPRRPAVAAVIRTALILCADHELNISAFAARCAASAGASPYDVVSAALATLKGFRHGGAASRVLSLVRRAGMPRSAREAVVERLRAGEPIPAFGHPLYPDGDPRAAVLIRLARVSGNDSAWHPFRNLLYAGSQLLGDAPNLDFGLAAIARTYRLPDDAPFILFALGRTIGWIAHAMEEYATGRLIRPRARYTGRMPGAPA